MTGKKKSLAADEGRLDEVGRGLVRASASNEAEAERAASAPFLYARIRSRIADRVQREEGERWLATLKVIWRAVPALALVAVMAFSLFLYVAPGQTRFAGYFGPDVLLDSQDAGVESVVYADTRNLSSDDVLATIMNDDEQEASR